MIFTVCAKAQNHNNHFQLWGFLMGISYGDFKWAGLGWAGLALPGLTWPGLGWPGLAWADKES
jgi:hypothetical protein